ncbi:hypothetical protein OE88DRAFT_1650767 [Heliocybe sulcata]|uniref:Uncharacterized protein n=1 Tax=Heliocybe sulcata TaxID=5364 RepID=A0A5C3NL14_9AGAM|nr:hypothetical protein OE88DRAFT_1650767 [Heliocybe sulcata]
MPSVSGGSAKIGEAKAAEETKKPGNAVKRSNTDDAEHAESKPPPKKQKVAEP